MAEINLEELNLRSKKPQETVDYSESIYHERIKRISNYVVEHENIKLILLAGPSGSGKTTTANLISDGIESLGKEALVISLDDFYRDHSDPNYPKNELGDHDYEKPESLNLQKIAKTLSFVTSAGPMLIVMAGDVKVDNRKYKDTFNNEKAKMLSFEETESIIGHAVGGVCPFCVKDGVKVYLDNSLKRFEYIHPACGSSNSAIKLTPAEIEQHSTNFVSWVDVTKPMVE